MAFKDHFSGIADAYAAARPGYPDALFDLLATHVPADATVWEPGCGSGQATRGLAARFAHVHATDPSPQQIAQHWASLLQPAFPSGKAAVPSQQPASLPPPLAGEGWGGGRVTLAVEPAEHTTLRGTSVQLIAVAQALHWFDRDAFFAECDRVLAPGGVLAAWGYADFLAPEGMADAVADFRALIDPYWPPERALIDAQYAGFDWPFPALPGPALWLEAEWPLAHFLRYLASMSATSRCRAAVGEDPVARHAPALAAAWGDPDELRTIRWPLFLHLRRKPSIPAL